MTLARGYFILCPLLLLANPLSAAKRIQMEMTDLTTNQVTTREIFIDAGFICTNYEGTQRGQKVSEICAASADAIHLSAADLQTLNKMRDFISTVALAITQNSPLPAMAPRSGINQPGIDGFPVQNITYEDGKAITREIFKSIAEVPLTDADFSTGTARKLGVPGQ